MADTQSDDYFYDLVWMGADLVVRDKTPFNPVEAEKELESVASLGSPSSFRNNSQGPKRPRRTCVPPLLAALPG